MCNTPVEVQFTSAGCLNYPCRTPLPARTGLYIPDDLLVLWFPPELLPAIFEPFRGRTNSSSRPGGLGLGLFISQQIATAHDGDIGVESVSTSGMVVFTVRLPRRRDHVAQTNTAE
jgi:hypothetical protein